MKHLEVILNVWVKFIAWRRRDWLGLTSLMVLRWNTTILFNSSNFNCLYQCLCRAEVDSLSARIQRLNAENDDLLQRLSEAKRLREQRERQFEEEKSELTKRIRELELNLKNGDESVQEAKDRIMNERKEHQVNQQVRINWPNSMVINRWQIIYLMVWTKHMHKEQTNDRCKEQRH